MRLLFSNQLFHMRDRKPIKRPITLASNPALARISHWRYAWHYPEWPLIWTFALLAGALLFFQISLWLGFLLVPIFVCDLLYWMHIDNHFYNGDVNPGVIIQLDPILIAVATDLRKGFGSYPAIKIIRTRLRRINNEPPRMGQILPTVASYFSIPNVKSPHWASFDPRPLESATTDENTLKRLMATFTVEQITTLYASIALLPSNEPGLYRFLDRRWQKVPDFDPSDILQPIFLWISTVSAIFFP